MLQRAGRLSGTTGPSSINPATGKRFGSAFPIAGYLVARASGTRSVLEPALGAALAVFGGVLFLSLTTPIAAIFALALAPIVLTRK